MDLLLILSGLLILINMGEQLGSPITTIPTNREVVVPIVLKKNLNISPKADRKAKQLEKRSARKQLKKQLREQVRQLRKQKAIPKGILFMLTVILAIGLVFLLLALACSIACSGSETLAVMVFFFGLGIIIFATITVLRNIQGKGKSTPPTGVQES